MRALAPGLLCFAILLSITPPASAAKVYFIEHGGVRIAVSIDGTIEAADVAKVEAFLSAPKTPHVFFVNSDGGDLEAAIAIGRLLRKKEIAVDVLEGSRCASACVFILAAGVLRVTFGDVIIHRPYLANDLPGASGYDANYKRTAQLIRGYLAEMNIPAALGDRMLAIPPDEGQTLTVEEQNLYMLNAEDPAHEQKRAAEEAHKWGISLAEQRRRQALQKRPVRGAPTPTYLSTYGILLRRGSHEGRCA